MKISYLIRFMLLHRATPLGSINCNHMNKLCLGDAVNVRELNEFWTPWRYWIGIEKTPPHVWEEFTHPPVSYWEHPFQLLKHKFHPFLLPSFILKSSTKAKDNWPPLTITTDKNYRQLFVPMNRKGKPGSSRKIHWHVFCKEIHCFCCLLLNIWGGILAKLLS